MKRAIRYVRHPGKGNGLSKFMQLFRYGPEITTESGYLIRIGSEVTAAGPGYAGKGTSSPLSEAE